MLDSVSNIVQTQLCYVHGSVCTSVSVCVCVRACVCMRACEYVCVCV